MKADKIYLTQGYAELSIVLPSGWLAALSLVVQKEKVNRISWVLAHAVRMVAQSFFIDCDFCSRWQWSKALLQASNWCSSEKCSKIDRGLASGVDLPHGRSTVPIKPSFAHLT
jgi:hypothetical protein